ncbi:MAG: hypothetical protein JWP52_4153 [Rhizobacter sp.]|nr:hypothetical protein [Rhizobacter sp.]
MTALVVVVSLLFSQLALASYVCPGAGDVVAMAEMTAGGMPCEGMDTAQPVMCHQHAANIAQSFEVAKVVTPTMPTVVQVLVVPPVLEAQLSRAFAVSATAEIWPPPDPLFLSTLRLRV